MCLLCCGVQTEDQFFPLGVLFRVSDVLFSLFFVVFSSLFWKLCLKNTRALFEREIQSTHRYNKNEKVRAFDDDDEDEDDSRFFFFGFSTSSDDGERSYIFEVVPKASSERSQMTKV